MPTSGTLESGDRSKPFVQSKVPVADEPDSRSEPPASESRPASTPNGDSRDDDGGLVRNRQTDRQTAELRVVDYEDYDDGNV